jgi:mRNA interferase HicA
MRLLLGSIAGNRPARWSACRGADILVRSRLIEWTDMSIKLSMNSQQFRRWLVKQGCTVDPGKGKGGHVVVRLSGRWTILPMHGGKKQLGTGLMEKIKKELGLK